MSQEQPPATSSDRPSVQLDANADDSHSSKPSASPELKQSGDSSASSSKSKALSDRSKTSSKQESENENEPGPERSSENLTSIVPDSESSGAVDFPANRNSSSLPLQVTVHDAVLKFEENEIDRARSSMAVCINVDNEDDEETKPPKPSVSFPVTKSEVEQRKSITFHSDLVSEPVAVSLPPSSTSFLSVRGLDQEAFLQKYKELKQILKAKETQIEILEEEKKAEIDKQLGSKINKMKMKIFKDRIDVHDDPDAPAKPPPDPAVILARMRMRRAVVLAIVFCGMVTMPFFLGDEMLDNF
eukprot:gene714-61_t